ncbi:MAG: type secretion system protein TssA [Pseudomonadota bacterium]|jgi:type VI secretion system protein ImpA
MSTFDISALLNERDPLIRSGPNLEYDPQFVELELLSQGKPEVQYGETITIAVPPDWKRIKELSLKLLERSHDLRLSMLLLQANLNLHAIIGMADGLQLAEQLLTKYWDSVHPQLDPEDGLDPTLRINSLAILADSNGIPHDLKDVTLIMLPALGPLTVRVLDAASSQSSSADGHEDIALSSLAAALVDVDKTALIRTTEALHRAHSSIETIEQFLINQVGSVQALNLEPLRRMIKRAYDFFADYGLPVTHENLNETGTDSDEALGPATASVVRATTISNEIASRDDVLRMLDKILKYYQQFEPSSPVPLLLGRAKNLVSKNFMEIMDDLAPDGVSQVMVLRGNQDNV